MYQIYNNKIPNKIYNNTILKKINYCILYYCILYYCQYPITSTIKEYSLRYTIKGYSIRYTIRRDLLYEVASINNMIYSDIRVPRLIKLTKRCTLFATFLPVKYCPKGDVHVQSGDPNLLEKRHSKCRVEPGKTASSPPGSTDALPDGILIRTVGGASSIRQQNQTSKPEHFK